MGVRVDGDPLGQDGDAAVIVATKHAGDDGGCCGVDRENPHGRDHRQMAVLVSLSGKPLQRDAEVTVGQAFGQTLPHSTTTTASSRSVSRSSESSSANRSASLQVRLLSSSR